jgi:hypothetical protein
MVVVKNEFFFCGRGEKKWGKKEAKMTRYDELQDVLEFFTF